jgi:hypothetical protein
MDPILKQRIDKVSAKLKASGSTIDWATILAQLEAELPVIAADLPEIIAIITALAKAQPPAKP